MASKKLSKIEQSMKDHGEVFLARAKAAAEGLNTPEVRAALKTLVIAAIKNSSSRDTLAEKVVSDLLGL